MAAPAAELMRTALRRSWQCNPGPCIPLGRDAWRVEIGGDQFIGKWVPLRRRSGLEAGLAAAEHVDAFGVGAGAPVRAADGALTVAEGDGVVALLHLVPGRPLHGGDPLDRQWWGDTLGAAHRTLRRFTHPHLTKFDPTAAVPHGPHIAIEPWLGPALRETAAAVRRIMVTDQLTYGVLHNDPQAAHFRLDPATGAVGLVGWSSAGTGPLLADLAAAVLSAGGPDAADGLVDAYLRASRVPRDECEAALPALLCLRTAVAAAEAAGCIHADGGRLDDHAELTRLAVLYTELADAL
ncbi:phosphotransferase enzyme family protein [Dactylosporangium sp. NPDC051541]|uniref:phosphotransferase enzyme family protein n=1 Tax=Dactylosporangium sp. NPDC051541 TaxID=3363977 RepID=UPI0037B1928E